MVAAAMLVFTIGGWTAWTMAPPAGATSAFLAGTGSPNWAGFLDEDIASANLRGADGIWTVPSVTCPPKGTSDVSVWVGIGGQYALANDRVESLYQDGTVSACTNGKATYYAWQQQAGTPNLAQQLGASTHIVSSLRVAPVKPGDKITASIVDRGLLTHWSICDVRNGQHVWTHTSFWRTDYQRKHTAECIVERPELLNGESKNASLAAFGQVKFSSCQVVDQSGKLWAMAGRQLPPQWSSYAITMTAGATVLAKPMVAPLSVLRVNTPSQSQTNPPSKSATPPYTYIGTFTTDLSGGGSVSARYSIGSPVTYSQPGAPPAEVLESCTSGDSPVLTDTSAYVPGQVTVTYSGTIPMDIQVGTGDIVGVNYQQLDEAAEEGDGPWACGGLGDNDHPVFENNLSPGQSITVKIWILIGLVLTNDSPTFVPMDHLDFAFDGATIAAPGSGPSASNNSTTGPHAVVCDEGGDGLAPDTYDPEISLFGSPPFSFMENPGTASCTSP